MKTRILRINAKRPESRIVEKAAKLLECGGIVAFPTETVYGLGAVAFNPLAVCKIFTAKGRPVDNPLIVHIGTIADVRKVALRVPPLAKELMRKFWPGPLTLVLQTSKKVPGIVRAGLPTVAVRMPAHPIARALCKAVGPIAAPSANMFGRPSPTKALHVYADLKGRISLILDGGSTHIGVESTIVSLVGKPKLLRPGKITIEQLRKYLPNIEIMTSVEMTEKPLAPGMKYRHYAPQTPVWLVKKPGAKMVQRLVEQERKNGKRVGLLCSERYSVNADKVKIIGKSPEDAAKKLFDALRWLDKQELEVIIAEGWSETGFGLAVMNRLRRMATRIL